MRSYNRRVFGRLDATSPLLKLYGTLVAIEIALKDAGLQCGKKGHDFHAAVSGVPFQPSTISVSQNVVQALTALQIDNGLAKGDNYPGIRYLKHVSDGIAPASSNADVQAALDEANKLVRELDREWTQAGQPHGPVVP